MCVGSSRRWAANVSFLLLLTFEIIQISQSKKKKILFFFFSQELVNSPYPKRGDNFTACTEHPTCFIPPSYNERMKLVNHEGCYKRNASYVMSAHQVRGGHW